MLPSSALCFSVAAEGEQGWEITLAPDTRLFAVELSEEIARGLEMASVIWAGKLLLEFAPVPVPSGGDGCPCTAPACKPALQEACDLPA